MHRKMSRIVVLLLVICLTLGNVVPVLAVDDSDSTTTVTATAEVSPSAEAEESAAPTSTPSATAETKETPAAAPTPTAKTETTASPETAETTATPTAAPSATTETSASPEASATATATAETTEEPAKVTFVPTAYGAAPVDEKVFTNSNKITSSVKDFALDWATSTSMISGGKLYLTLSLNPDADGSFPYTYLYLGDKDDLDKVLEEGGELDVVAAGESNGKQTFHFVTNKGLIGEQKEATLVVYALKADGSAAEVTITFTTKTMPVNNTVTEVTYPAAPATEEEMAVKGDEGMYVYQLKDPSTPYSMFKVLKATAIKVNGTIYATIYVSPRYAYVGFASKTVLDNGGEVSATKGTTVVLEDGTETRMYHLSFPANSVEGNAKELCLIKDTYTTTNSNWNSSPVYLKVPDSIPEGTVEPVFTPVDHPAAPVAEKVPSNKISATTKATVGNVAFKLDGNNTTAMISGGKLYLTLSASTDADYLYLGTEDELKKVLEEGGKLDVVAAGESDGKQTFHFVTDKGEIGTNTKVTLTVYALKADGTYTTVTLKFSKLPVNNTVTAVTYPAAPNAEGELAIEGMKVYTDAAGTTPASMFNVDSATAVKVDGTIYATIYVTKTNAKGFTYSYFGIGSKTRLDNGGEVSATAAGLTDDDEPRQIYHFTLNEAQVDANGLVEICIIKSDYTTTNGWNTNPYYLKVPADIQERVAVPIPDAVSYDAAPVEEKKLSGLTATMQNETASLFDIASVTAIRYGDITHFTFTVNSVDGAFPYSCLYLDNETALKAALEQGGKYPVVKATEENGQQFYHFTLPSSAVGTSVSVCAVKEDNTYEPLTLAIPAKVTAGTKPVWVDYDAAPAKEADMKDKMLVSYQGKSDPYSMFVPIEGTTALKVDDLLYITIQTKANNARGEYIYPYLRFDTRANTKDHLDNVGGELSVVYGENGLYHFTLPLSQLTEVKDSETGKTVEYRVPICLLKDTLQINGSELELIISAPLPEESTDPGEDPDKKPEAAPAIPKLPDDLSEAGIKVLKVEDGAEFKMFTAAKTGMVVAGEKLLIRFETANTSYDKLYFGSKDDAFKSPYVQGTERTGGGWVFEFELPASYRGAENPISLGKPDGTWYTGKDLLISIPANTGDTGTEISDAEMKMVAAGSFIEASFQITSSSATLIGDTIYCTITGTMGGNQTGKTATKLYIGSRDDKDKSSAVSGSVNGLETTFSFSVSADKQGTSIPIVVGFADGTWDTNQDFFLNVPNFGRTFDLSYYTDGVYDLYGNAYAYLDKADRRSFAVDTQSTLTVSGDTITIKWVTRASDIDKIYMGSVTDAKDTREAQALSSTDYEPIGMNYKVFYITLPKSALGSQIPFVRHSRLWWPETDGWLENQDYLVLTDYLPRLTDDTETRLDDAGIRMLAGGSQVEQSFKITSSSAVLKGTTITCTITGKPAGNNSSKTADKLYLGDRSDKDKSGYVTGTVNGDGTTTFVYTVNAERQGSYTPAVLGFSDNSWDTTQSYFLNVPNFNGAFDASAFTDGVYDLFGYAYTKNGVIPVDAGATLTVSGDTITIKYVTRTSGYSKLYFGSVADDAATRDAAAVSAGILNPDDAYSYRYFSVTLPKSALAETIPFVSCSKNGTWSTKQDQLLVPRFLPRIGGATDPDPVDPSDPGSVIKDGSTYYTTGESGASMFRVRRVVITAKDGKYDVTLTLNGTSYDYLFPGTGAQASAADKSTWSPAKVVSGTIDGETRDNWHTYTITVDELTNPLAVTSHSQKNDTWYDRSITLDLENLKRTAEDGKYSVTAECGAAMFKIVDAKLNVVNGTILATLTLSGTGYDYLYPGTGDQAENDKDNWAPFAVDENGKYTYTIPVSELDKPIIIASHSQKNNIWYDRTVTFDSSTLKKIGDATDPVGPTPTPTPTPAPVDPTKPDDESDHETDTSGSTSRVNNSTTLKDGTYAPDSFSFSGGSGRTRIVCDKVTVKNGQAYATIRFVSSSGNPPQFSYVKASGNTYYSNDGCTFTIPVELNKNNRILGMTTKMSSAHEIEYIIFVQLKTTANGQKDTEKTTTTLSTEAPEIMGLTFQEEIRLDHAQYLKLFRYEGNIVLAEIDVMTDTVLDTERAKAEIEKADKAAAAENTDEAVAEEESVDNAQIKADYVSELYKQNILRYLLVPEGTELPAGLEKQLIIVTLPVKSLYVMDETPVDTLDIFEALNLVKVFGAETAENETLAAALADGSTVCGGTWDKPEYKKLVQNKTDLVLTSGKLLPLNEETLTARKETAPADAEELTAVEYRDRLYDLADRFAVLDIPMLIDRSSDEADALAQADWLKLYGVLLGDETTADRMIREITSREG